MNRKMSLLALLSIPACSQCEILHYGGDWDPNYSQQYAPVFGGGCDFILVFDDFEILTSTIVTSLFCTVARAQTWPISPRFGFEIRMGMSVGNAGTLVASSNLVSGYSVALGATAYGIPMYKEGTDPRSIQLDPGRYWLALRPVLGGLYLPTSGANGVGTSVANNNTFGFSCFWQNLNYNSMSAFYGLPSYDISLGVEGTVVPEPVCLTSLGTGVLLFLKRRSA